MVFIRPIVAILIIFAICWLFSFDRKTVPKYLKKVGFLFILELLVCFVLLHTTFGTIILKTIAAGFVQLMKYAAVGIEFVFKEPVAKSGTLQAFLFQGLLPMVFICSLIGILKYFGILQFIIRIFGLLFNKLLHLGEVESYTAVSSLILGMTPVYVSLKDILYKLDKRTMYTIGAMTLSTVDLTVIGAYMKMVPPKFVIIGIFLNMIGVFIITTLINPYTPGEFDLKVKQTDEEKKGFFDTLLEYTQDGFNVVLSIIPMLLAFISLIALLNGISSWLTGNSLQNWLGIAISPLAYLMGVDWADATKVGGIMMTKLLTNEFVAMTDLTKISSTISTKSLGIISVFLISFSNFASVGMIVAVVSTLNKEMASVLSNNLLKLLLGSFLVSCLSATVVGIFI
ncbi:nucleoside transport protein [Secundilactobacillus pentosiphilus]|uniref:Nucleoside transport protein n=1 Tax=Secundilactobacillus pentosiphilus TaxID=1714682 RepID=A0A1Z5IY20_9LACO|nr:nucleoside transporter C-terminal domain-containing protein [Secundilactobacillus pentosiphilus]GAX06371.1 nucleoside transport protein [Secundilactobacillus pentosiphilus]